jgi:hypothetical protein
VQLKGSGRLNNVLQVVDGRNVARAAKKQQLKCQINVT